MENIEIHRHAVNDKFSMHSIRKIFTHEQIISAIEEINTNKKYVEIAIKIAH